MKDIPQQSPELKTLVNKSLKDVRKKLIDLSRRNRLLNFPHRPSKTLRFVDGLPDQIYRKLLNNDDSKSEHILTISYVPLPKEKDYPEIKDPEQLRKINAKAHAKKLGVPTEWKMQDYTESHNNDSGSENILTISYVPLPKETDYPEIKDPE